MAINIRGTFLMVKHVAPHMIARKYGKIINIGSGTVVRGIPWMLHYVAIKGGDHRDDARDVARARRRRHPRQHADAGLHPERLIVNENPGHVETRAAARSPRARSSATCIREDLLGALVFLASADSDFVTGQTIAVDGGQCEYVVSHAETQTRLMPA